MRRFSHNVSYWFLTCFPIVLFFSEFFFFIYFLSSKDWCNIVVYKIFTPPCFSVLIYAAVCVRTMVNLY
jgi:hypothetical protein